MSALNVFLLWDQEEIQGNLLIPLHHSPYLQGMGCLEYVHCSVAFWSSATLHTCGQGSIAVPSLC